MKQAGVQGLCSVLLETGERQVSPGEQSMRVESVAQWLVA